MNAIMSVPTKRYKLAIGMVGHSILLSVICKFIIASWQRSSRQHSRRRRSLVVSVSAY